ncbi:antA/AntB antirepressor family protein [Leclercia adecarboxylata]|uniref:antA/AntB antirepressor family protein n=1 Tax=Leclercia TaxID=83654 RepID=UPI003AAAC80C
MMKNNMTLAGQGLAHPEASQERITNKDFASFIPVISGRIGGREANIVSAKSLHQTLGVRRVFGSWFNGRVSQYGFIKGTDFDQLTPERVGINGAGRPEVDYAITIGMAKELAMVERNQQGRDVRQYFIQCEEELHRSAPEVAARFRRQLKARLNAANYFKPMCEALDAARAELGKQTQQRHYANESNMLARIVLGGLTAKQWAENGSITGEPRDSMSTEQLEHLSYLEQTNITLIELGQDYQQRKVELMRLSQRWLAKRLGVNHA